MALYTFYLGGELGGLLKSTLHPVLMHHPLRLPPLRGPSLVEHQCLPHPYQCPSPRHCPILPSSLPVTRHRGPVRPLPRCIFSILEAEEVPLPRPH